MITFGPVPSRRLGQSLGINNIPGDKICTYACIYCQVGATRHYTLERASYYSPEQILAAVEEHLSKLQAVPDYLTFVPNGFFERSSSAPMPSGMRKLPGTVPFDAPMKGYR